MNLAKSLFVCFSLLPACYAADAPPRVVLNPRPALVCARRYTHTRFVLQDTEAGCTRLDLGDGVIQGVDGSLGVGLRIGSYAASCADVLVAPPEYLIPWGNPTGWMSEERLPAPGEPHSYRVINVSIQDAFEGGPFQSMEIAELDLNGTEGVVECPF